MEEIKTEVKRGRGRPRKIESKVKQPRERTRAGGFRDKLTVGNRDPNYVYRWVIDMDATGSRILQMKRAGYEFVFAEEGIRVGEADVFTSVDGDIIRRPANKHGDFNYLMKIPREWYEQDKLDKQKDIARSEQALYEPEALSKDKAEGNVYGALKIDR